MPVTTKSIADLLSDAGIAGNCINGWLYSAPSQYPTVIDALEPVIKVLQEDRLQERLKSGTQINDQLSGEYSPYTLKQFNSVLGYDMQLSDSLRLRCCKVSGLSTKKLGQIFADWKHKTLKTQHRSRNWYREWLQSLFFILKSQTAARTTQPNQSSAKSRVHEVKHLVDNLAVRYSITSDHSPLPKHWTPSAYAFNALLDTGLTWRFITNREFILDPFINNYHTYRNRTGNIEADFMEYAKKRWKLLSDLRSHEA